MALDASLILGGKAPQLDDPLTIRAKQATLADLMGRQQLQQMQMQGKQFELEDAQRARQDQQTLADLYRTAGTDPNALMQGMAQQGLGARIPAFQEQQAKTGKALTDAEAAKLKLAQEKIKIVGARLSARLANPNITHEDVIGDLTNLVAEGVIDQAHGARLARGLSANPRQDLLRAGMELMGENERINLALGKTELVDKGGAHQAYTTNQLTGQVTPGQTFEKTATPEAVMLDKRTREEGAANRGVQIRGQNLTDARAKEAAVNTQATAKIPQGYRVLPNGDLEAIPGGPADAKKVGQLNADTQALTGATSGLDRLATAANEALNHPGLKGTYGLRGMVPNVPGSDAADAAALLNTLKSQVGFSVLQDMRNNSKTGGALGAVSDKENAMLQANLAALEKAQSFEQAQKSLKKIVEYSDQAKGRMLDAYNMRHPGINTPPTAATTAPAAGNTVTTPDGKTHTFPNAAAAAAFKKAAGL